MRPLTRHQLMALGAAGVAEQVAVGLYAIIVVEDPRPVPVTRGGSWWSRT